MSLARFSNAAAFWEPAFRKASADSNPAPQGGSGHSCPRGRLCGAGRELLPGTLRPSDTVGPRSEEQTPSAGGGLSPLGAGVPGSRPWESRTRRAFVPGASGALVLQRTGSSGPAAARLGRQAGPAPPSPGVSASRALAVTPGGTCF